MADDDKDGRNRPAWVEITLGLIELLKAAFWPLLVLAGFVSLYGPLRTLLDDLPDVLGRADVVTIGELHVKLNKALDVEAPPDVRNALKGLSSGAALRLIQLSQSIYAECLDAGHPARYDRQAAIDQQLAAHGLATMDFRPEQDVGDKSKCYSVRTTDLGDRTQKVLTGVLVQSFTLHSDQDAQPKQE